MLLSEGEKKCVHIFLLKSVAFDFTFIICDVNLYKTSR